MVEDGAFSHKIDYVAIFLEILNLEGIGSRVTAILLNGWTLPIGEAASRRVCACSLRSRLVLLDTRFSVFLLLCRFGICHGRTYIRTKIEKPRVGQPFYGPAKIHPFSKIAVTLEPVMQY